MTPGEAYAVKACMDILSKYHPSHAALKEWLEEEDVVVMEGTEEEYVNGCAMAVRFLLAKGLAIPNTNDVSKRLMSHGGCAIESRTIEETEGSLAEGTETVGG